MLLVNDLLITDSHCLNGHQLRSLALDTGQNCESGLLSITNCGLAPVWVTQKQSAGPGVSQGSGGCLLLTCSGNLCLDHAGRDEENQFLV